MIRTKKEYKIITEVTVTGTISDEECKGCYYDEPDHERPIDCPESIDCSTPVKTKNGLKFIVWEIVR